MTRNGKTVGVAISQRLCEDMIEKQPPFPGKFLIKRSTYNNPMTSTADPFSFIICASHKFLKQTLGNLNTVLADITL